MSKSPAPARELANPHVCARCAAGQPGCCVLQPGEEKICFPLFPEEVERISAHLGHRRWLAREPNLPEFIQVMKRMFPLDQPAVERLFPLDDVHYRLGTDSRGRCVFLEDTGCSLPRPVRPYHCRIFPLWMRGRRLMVLEAECLARQEAATLEDLLQSLGTSGPQVRELFKRMRRAWGLPPAA